jgi:hypothetical protein
MKLTLRNRYVLQTVANYCDTQIGSRYTCSVDAQLTLAELLVSAKRSAGHDINARTQSLLKSYRNTYEKTSLLFP